MANHNTMVHSIALKRLRSLLWFFVILLLLRGGSLFSESFFMTPIFWARICGSMGLLALAGCLLSFLLIMLAPVLPVQKRRIRVAGRENAAEPEEKGDPQLDVDDDTNDQELEKGWKRMGWQEELDTILVKLNVRHENEVETVVRSGAARAFVHDDSLPEMTIIQSSRTYYGVHYRMDLIDDEPHLRIEIPVDTGPLKLTLYAVRLAHKQLSALFTASLNVQGGSEVFQEHKVSLEWSLLYSYCGWMKELFWQGDIQTMTFPPETIVEQLL